MSNLPKRVFDLGNKTLGKDKFCRFLQYSFKGLADLLERLAADRYGSAILKFKELDGSIGAARRLFRLGRSFEMIYLAKDALHIRDMMIQTCMTLSRISSACYLFLDHIIWLHKAKAISIDIKAVSRLSSQFWLFSTILNLVRNMYDWERIYNSSVLVRKDEPMIVPPLIPTILDTVRNSFDILIPMNSLQLVQVPGVVQGLTGAISSLIGLATMWNIELKLINK